MAIERKTVWLALVGSLIFPAVASAQALTPTQGQVLDPPYALGNAPHSNPRPGQYKNHTPLSPHEFEQDWQPFAPADISDYGRGIKPHYGWYGTYERLYWGVGRADTVDIGSAAAERVVPRFGGGQPVGLPIIPAIPGQPVLTPTPTPPVDNFINVFETNSLETDMLRVDPAWGNRYEFGYMDTDNHGWLVTIIDKLTKNQVFVENDVQVLFDDPFGILRGFYDANLDGFDDDLDGDNIYGRFGRDTDLDGEPDELIQIVDEDEETNLINYVDTNDEVELLPRFNTLVIKNRVTMNGFELLKTYRAPQLHDGGYFELLYGARYLQFRDRFLLAGTGGVLALGDPEEEILGLTRINTVMDNNLIGPEIGGRWFNQHGRWIWSVEARFLAAANVMNGRQTAILASQQLTQVPGRQVPFLIPVTTRDNDTTTEFSPTGEFRLSAAYAVTKAFSLKAGYTALVMGNIQRASNHVDYNVPNVGILDTPGETTFAQGLTFGIEFNR